MATIKIKFRPSTISGKEGSVFYRIIHKRKTCQITSGQTLFPEEWNQATSSPVIPSVDSPRYNKITAVAASLAHDTERLHKIIDSFLNSGQAFTTDMIISHYHSIAGTGGIITYASQLIDRLMASGKECTANTYRNVVNSFTRFMDNADISLMKVNADLFLTYDSYLKDKGLCANSISYYMRNMRAIYNRAVEEGLTEQRNPFTRVYTGIAKTEKRAISLHEIKKIKNLCLDGEPALAFARDMFMFSFYTRGMSVIDMAFLQKSSLANGILTYRRKKTGQKLKIKWEKPMQDIVDRHQSSESPFLLPILGNPDSDLRKQYRNKAHLINHKLKEIGKRLSISTSLTLYVARHCWASVAHSKNVPLSVISEGMGHDSEKTTLIYLASLDTSSVDKANNLIINSI